MANPKPEYIGDEWFESGGSPATRAADERARQGMTEAAEAVGAKPAAPQVYGGLGGYQYEIRGNDIFITGSKGKKLATPIRVDPKTAKGATAYNAIIAELAPEGVTLQRVKVPVAEEPGYKGRDTTPDYRGRSTSEVGALGSILAETSTGGAITEETEYRPVQFDKKRMGEM